jgi:uncharacterized membrane protein
MNLSLYFILFIIYSFIGWIGEVCLALYTKKKFINRGFLIGPYCPIYGVGAIVVTLLLNKYIDSPLVVFTLSVVICSIVEYFTSYILEKIFNTSWWDYSDNKFNLNGRICLRFMILFGIGCTIVIYITNPFLFNILNKIPNNILDIIAIILLVIFVSDLITSFIIIWKFKEIANDSHKDNTEKVTEFVRKKILDSQKALYKRIVNAFPRFKILKWYKQKKK